MRISATRLAPLALALVALLGVASPAPAAEAGASTTRKDPRDDVFLSSVGGGIDLAAVNLTTVDRDRIRVTFRLHSPPDLERSLERPGGLTLHAVRDARTTELVRIFTVDGELRSTVCTQSSRGLGRIHDCQRLPATQLDDAAYRTVVKRSRIVGDTGTLRWFAQSLDISNGDPVSDLLDRDGAPFAWSP